MPGCTPVASPKVLAALLMVANAGCEEVQFTKLVRFWVSPFAKVPVAANGNQNPTGTLLLAGVTWIELSCADSTSALAVPMMDPSCAVIVTVPADWPITKPFGLTVATLLLEEVQVHSGLIHCLVPSLKVPYAAMPAEEPGAIATEFGLMVIDDKVAEVTVI